MRYVGCLNGPSAPSAAHARNTQNDALCLWKAVSHHKDFGHPKDRYISSIMWPGFSPRTDKLLMPAGQSASVPQQEFSLLKTSYLGARGYKHALCWTYM